MSPSVKVFVSYFLIQRTMSSFVETGVEYSFIMWGWGGGGLCQYKLRVRHLSSIWSILDESEISKFNDKVV